MINTTGSVLAMRRENKENQLSSCIVCERTATVRFQDDDDDGDDDYDDDDHDNDDAAQ